MPRAADLGRKMKARFGVGIVQYAPLAYDVAWAMIEAMKKADSTDPNRNVDMLRGNTFIVLALFLQWQVHSFRRSLLRRSANHPGHSGVCGYMPLQRPQAALYS